MDKSLDDKRLLLANFARDLFNRHLTDVAGGNLSMRIGDRILMTPKMAGTSHHWNLRPEQILVFDLSRNKLDGEGEVSREALVHFDLLEAFYPKITAVVHSHTRNVLVFCAAEKPMPPVLYATKKFGTIAHCQDAASGTQDLADFVLEGFRCQMERVEKGAAAVMAPRHGLFVVGKDIFVAFDSTERIDTNAYCLIHGQALGELVPVDEATAVVNPSYE
jgi:ribulose-5-phosphate 4-epimerase/fuculose-1-phosphate aldolase